MPVITQSENLRALCDTLSTCDFVAVDTEFLREKTYFPRLCLIQISGPDKQAKAIDPLADDLDLSPLFDVLYNPDITKVFHAARQDLEIFYHLTGKVVTPFFDTQIAAMVCGYGDSVGYENIVRQITGKKIDKSAQVTNWSVRPLSERQIDYALRDVTCLCDVYRHLKTALERRERTDWLVQEERILEDPKTYENDPDTAWTRIKIRSAQARNLAILRALAAWRERQAHEADIPRTWIVRDEILSDIARQIPRTTTQLSRVRNIPKDILNGKIGVRLLEEVEKALGTPQETWPAPKTGKPVPAHIRTIVDILKMLRNIQSTKHEVAPKLIATMEDLENIALNDDADVPALRGWRREIFGADALAVKHGKLAIGLKNGKITKFPLADS